MGQGSVSPSDALTIIRGKNILNVGGEFDRLSDNLDGWGTTNTGNFTFSGIFTRNPADLKARASDMRTSSMACPRHGPLTNTRCTGSGHRPVTCLFRMTTRCAEISH